MTFPPFAPLADLCAALAGGRSTSRALVETALERIAHPDGQGRTVFIDVDAAAARAAADASDALRRSGTTLSPLMGVPVSIKDLFDVAGQVTRAGSRVLDGTPPATRDAAAVARLRQAGAILLGRTNMTEFAFSGLGLNPHYGTPLSPYDRAQRRIAGGSSSGAAASVADGMAAAALGTDTGGSIRIPAALCGLTGFKPTAARVSTAGVWALSPTLDSVGPLGRSVACCTLLDAVLSGDTPVPAAVPASVAPAPAPRTWRIGVLRNVVLEGLDAPVARAFEAALARLGAAGVALSDVRIPALDDLPRINRFGFSVLESHRLYGELVGTRAAEFDPRVRVRLVAGAAAGAADYDALRAQRGAVIDAVREAFRPFDAVVFPTTALIAPKLADFDGDSDRYAATNALILRNPGIVNFFDGCAVTVPCHAPGEPPVGLTLSATGGNDAMLLAVASSLEKTILP